LQNSRRIPDEKIAFVDKRIMRVNSTNC